MQPDELGVVRSSVNPLESAGHASLFSVLADVGVVMNVRRGGDVFVQGESARNFYWLTSGLVRTGQVLPDGRRQIFGFHRPGELIGFEAGELFSYAAEVMRDARVVSAPRDRVFSAAQHDRAIMQSLWRLAMREMALLRRGALGLIKTAEERVADFLLGMFERADADEIDLAMSRQEIADHLGLTIETVSRNFTLLVNASVIDMQSSRRLRLKDEKLLRDRAAGAPDETWACVRGRGGVRQQESVQ